VIINSVEKLKCQKTTTVRTPGHPTNSEIAIHLIIVPIKWYCLFLKVKTWSTLVYLLVS